MGRLEACFTIHATAHAQPDHHGWSNQVGVNCTHLVPPHQIASTAGAAAWLPHSKRCVTAIRGGEAVLPWSRYNLDPQR
ncbi:MAG: hypothetical protein D6716_12260 [Chloroflexi bacterium]|nr:MAG: hypothetical protein D6716_12260 [Chloroflexota bacterium]